ncbi:thermonuclease family protein [Candidatus Pacearchaeota archaeon]|nr:thermonuclease family protein [Candidatus Pacearchaeota archaeon]
MVKYIKKKIKSLDDGDSGVFADGTRFRLANVRAHEKHQFGGTTAKRTLGGMIGRTKRIVQVRTVARGVYGRSIVEIKNKDGSINERMRKKGYKNKGR